MNFPEALSAVLTGKKVQRALWHDEHVIEAHIVNVELKGTRAYREVPEQHVRLTAWLELIDGVVHLHTVDDRVLLYAAGAEDIAATDWKEI